MCVLTRPDLPTASSGPGKVIRAETQDQSKTNGSEGTCLSIQASAQPHRAEGGLLSRWGKSHIPLKWASLGWKPHVSSPDDPRPRLYLCRGGALIQGSLPPCQDSGESGWGGQTSPPLCPRVFCFWGKERPSDEQALSQQWPFTPGVSEVGFQRPFLECRTIRCQSLQWANISTKPWFKTQLEILIYVSDVYLCCTGSVVSTLFACQGLRRAWYFSASWRPAHEHQIRRWGEKLSSETCLLLLSQPVVVYWHDPTKQAPVTHLRDVKRKETQVHTSEKQSFQCPNLKKSKDAQILCYVPGMKPRWLTSTLPLGPCRMSASDPNTSNYKQTQMPPEFHFHLKQLADPPVPPVQVTSTRSRPQANVNPIERSALKEVEQEDTVGDWTTNPASFSSPYRLRMLKEVCEDVEGILTRSLSSSHSRSRTFSSISATKQFSPTSLLLYFSLWPFGSAVLLWQTIKWVTIERMGIEDFNFQL